jgi:hypothetical protein
MDNVMGSPLRENAVLEISSCRKTGKAAAYAARFDAYSGA